MQRRRELLGVGRLVADPDHESVEYAVLVGDKWQNMGLGSVLTECCLDIACRWGLQRVVAQTGSDNARMLTLFKRLGFATSPSADGSVIEAVMTAPGSTRTHLATFFSEFLRESMELRMRARVSVIVVFLQKNVSNSFYKYCCSFTTKRIYVKNKV